MHPALPEAVVANRPHRIWDCYVALENSARVRGCERRSFLLHILRSRRSSPAAERPCVHLLAVLLRIQSIPLVNFLLVAMRQSVGNVVVKQIGRYLVGAQVGASVATAVRGALCAGRRREVAEHHVAGFCKKNEVRTTGFAFVKKTLFVGALLHLTASFSRCVILSRTDLLDTVPAENLPRSPTDGRT